MSTAADDVDETPGVGGGDGNGTPPELVDDVPAVGGDGGNGNQGMGLGDDVDNALQPAQPAATNMLHIHKRRVNKKVTHLNNFVR